jgi:hypothetical protein
VTEKSTSLIEEVEVPDNSANHSSDSAEFSDISECSKGKDVMSTLLPMAKYSSDFMESESNTGITSRPDQQVE